MRHEAYSADQGMPLTAAVLLRGLGWDAMHVSELGMHRTADAEILDRAASESRALITLDRDFPQILALTSQSRPSIVLVRQQGLRGAEAAALIQTIWNEHELALEKGSVLVVGTRGTRIRLLPLK